MRFQIVKSEVEIYEGSYTGGISVITNVPPRLYCLYEDRDRDCRISILTQLQVYNKEIKCPNGRQISQLTFPLSDIDDPCTRRITADTWKTALLIPLQGTIDQIKDKDQTRTVKVTAKIMAAGLEFDSVNIGEVQVFSY